MIIISCLGLIDSLGFDWVPILMAMEASMVFLRFEPLVQAVLVVCVHARSLHCVTWDFRVIHTDTVIADGDQVIFADVTMFGALITHPTCYCIPFDELENLF